MPVIPNSNKGPVKEHIVTDVRQSLDAPMHCFAGKGYRVIAHVSAEPVSFAKRAGVFTWRHRAAADEELRW
jgi:hypothetical protein